MEGIHSCSLLPSTIPITRKCYLLGLRSPILTKGFLTPGNVPGIKFRDQLSDRITHAFKIGFQRISLIIVLKARINLDLDPEDRAFSGKEINKAGESYFKITQSCSRCISHRLTKWNCWSRPAGSVLSERRFRFQFRFGRILQASGHNSPVSHV